MRIGLIGVGVVGNAVKTYFRKRGDQVWAYDVDPSKSNCLYSDVLKTDVIFVSVPTPVAQKRFTQYKYDLSNLIDVLKNLNKAQYKGVVAHKCTVAPGQTRDLKEKFKHLNLVHFPEFLTEKNAVADFEKQKTILLSGRFTDCIVVKTAFDDNTEMQYSQHYESTEMAKLMHNCFLATKVSFFNEMFEFCEKLGVSYTKVIEMAETQNGIGHSHIKVPGPDGRFGFGGMCLVKDLLALQTWAHSKNLIHYTLFGAIKTNILARPSAHDGTEDVGVRYNCNDNDDAISEV